MSNCALRPTLNILLNADVLPKRNVNIMLVPYIMLKYSLQIYIYARDPANAESSNRKLADAGTSRDSCRAQDLI